MTELEAPRQEPGTRSRGGRVSIWLASLLSLASLLLLLLVPESVKPWVHEHLPALRHPHRCGAYGHLFFGIGVAIAGSGLAWGIAIVKRSGSKLSTTVSTGISATMMAGWLIYWGYVRGLTSCVGH